MHDSPKVVKKRLAQYAKSGMGLLLLLLFTACGGVTQAPTLETFASAFEVGERGLVLEAEAFHANAPKGKHAWTKKGGALHALPDVRATYNRNFTTRSPRLDYKISVAQPGTYYVWVSGRAAGSSRSTSDSVHVGLNGRAVKSADRMSGFGPKFGWEKSTMDGSRAKLELPKGTHTLNVWMREDGFAFDQLILTRDAKASPETLLAALAPKEEVFAPSADGLIDIQAEAFHVRQAPSRHTWQRTGELMKAVPDNGTVKNSNFEGSSPRLDYRVYFKRPGTYYVWARGQAAGTSERSSDSVHVGLNGEGLKSADRISEFTSSLGWSNSTMDNSVAKIKVEKAGVHTLNVWMREDGFALGKLVLSTDPNYAPKGAVTASGPTLLPVAPGTGGSSSAASLPRVQAKTADAFIDTIGINTHLHYQDTVYYRRFEDLIKPKLLELGVRHVRDGAYTYEEARRNTFFYKRLRELGAAGIDFTLLTSFETRYNEATDYSKLDDIVSWTDGAVAAFEGINEPDLQGVKGWASLTRDAQKKLYQTVKSNPALKDVKVLGPSPVWKTKELGDLSRYMDYGNTHPYPGGKMPTASENNQSTKINMRRAARNSGDKPIMFTETGYHNATETDDNHLPTSEQATAKYLPRMLLAHFNMDVPRTYLYELIDSRAKGRTEDPEASFGLLRYDGSEKPAFRAVKNLTGLLADAGPSFTPDALRLAFGGDTDDLHYTLLQKRDGTFYLALWLEKESWDRHALEDLKVAKQNITVALGERVKSATLHTLDGAGRMSEKAVSLSGDKLNLNVGDSVTVLELR